MTATRGTASTTRLRRPVRTRMSDDEADDDEDYPPEGGRRKRRGRSIPGLPRGAGRAGPDRRWRLRRGHQGRGVHPRPVLHGARLPGPGPRQGHLRGQGRRHRRADRPQPQGQGRRAVGRRVHRGRRRRVQHPGRLLPAEEGDAGGRRVRHPQQPGQHHQEHRHHPRGPAGRRRSSRGWPRRPTIPAKAFEKALADPAKLGLPDYAGGNPEGYLFPSTYDFGPNDKPVDMLKKMVARWQQAADDAGLEDGAAALGLHAARDHDDRQPDRGRGPRRLPRQDRAGHLQPARDRPQPVGRLPADRRERQLRAGPQRLDRDHRRGQGVGRPTRRTTSTRTRGCRRRRSRRRATTRSRPR